MTYRKENSHRAYGFTLIELIIVLAIVAVTAAVSIPRLGAIFEAKSFRQMVNKAIVFLRDARVDALSTGKKVSVVVDLKEGKFIRSSPEGADGDERNLQMPDGVEIGVELEDKFGDEDVEFTFYPNGTASGPRLLLKDSDKGKNAIIYLEPLAGLIRCKIGTADEST